MTAAKHPLREVVAALAEPFAPHEIKFLVQARTQDKKSGMAAPYIDARMVMDRLDEVVGPENWSFNVVQVLDNGAVVGQLSVFDVHKSDVGYVQPDNNEADEASIKGSSSDALKRAAVHFGIGRFLYSLPKTWGDLDERGRNFKNPEAIRAKLFPNYKPSKTLREKAEDMGAKPVDDGPTDDGPTDDEILNRQSAAAPKSDGPVCPKHGKAKRNQRGLYCPTKDPDGAAGWCEWSSK
jgi:hypothetical protein